MGWKTHTLVSPKMFDVFEWPGEQNDIMSTTVACKGNLVDKSPYNVYISMYVYIYIYIYTHIHIYIYTYRYIQVHVHIYIYIYVSLSLSLYIYIYIDTHTHIHTLNASGATTPLHRRTHECSIHIGMLCLYAMLRIDQGYLEIIPGQDHRHYTVRRTPCFKIRRPWRLWASWAPSSSAPSR